VKHASEKNRREKPETRGTEKFVIFFNGGGVAPLPKGDRRPADIYDKCKYTSVALAYTQG
jgi:hypothetical protein